MKQLVFLAVTALLVVPNVFADDHLVSGTITAVDKGAKTVTLKTADGTEHTAEVSEETTVKGTKDLASGTAAVAKTTALGVKKGSQAVVHYSVEGEKKTAHSIKVVGDQPVKVSKGIVTAVDHGTKTFSVKTADGAEKTYHLASDGVVETGKKTKAGTEVAAKETTKAVTTGTKETTKAVTTGTKVTVHYTEEGGKKIVHGIVHVF